MSCSRLLTFILPSAFVRVMALTSSSGRFFKLRPNRMYPILQSTLQKRIAKNTSDINKIADLESFILFCLQGIRSGFRLMTIRFYCTLLCLTFASSQNGKIELEYWLPRKTKRTNKTRKLKRSRHDVHGLRFFLATLCIWQCRSRG